MSPDACGVGIGTPQHLQVHIYTRHQQQDNRMTDGPIYKMRLSQMYAFKVPGKHSNMGMQPLQLSCATRGQASIRQCTTVMCGGQHTKQCRMTIYKKHSIDTDTHCTSQMGGPGSQRWWEGRHPACNTHAMRPCRANPSAVTNPRRGCHPTPLAQQHYYKMLGKHPTRPCRARSTGRSCRSSGRD